MLTPGIKGHAALRVTTENTALAMGSGELCWPPPPWRL